MSCFTRSVVRWGLIGGLALGGLTLLVGPERVGAGFSQLRTKAQSMFDSNISDPVALRRQLAPMQEQYEERLQMLAGEIATVEQQLAQYDYDAEVWSKIVADATEDLADLKSLVSRAEAEAKSSVRPVAIRFNGTRFNIDQAYNEARRINSVRQHFNDRLAQDQHQLSFLTEQLTRLRSIHDELEEEYTTFQVQFAQLERQIDSIERNERLIALTKQQQETLANYERMGTVGNLKQLEGKLAQLRAIQEAQLKTLESRGLHNDYERNARRAVGSAGSHGAGNGGGASYSEDPFAEIEDAPADHRNNGKADRSVAWYGPVVVE